MGNQRHEAIGNSNKSPIFLLKCSQQLLHDRWDLLAAKRESDMTQRHRVVSMGSREVAGPVGTLGCAFKGATGDHSQP